MKSLGNFNEDFLEYLKNLKFQDDNIAASKERVGGVYKLVAVEKEKEIEPRIKVSNDTVKTTNPGYKKVYRFYDKKTGYALGDVITWLSETILEDYYILIHESEEWKQKSLVNYEVRPLQVPIFEDGNLVYTDPSLEEKRSYCEREVNSLYPEVTRIVKPSEYYVDLSEELKKVKQDLINKHKNMDTPKKLVKSNLSRISN